MSKATTDVTRNMDGRPRKNGLSQAERDAVLDRWAAGQGSGVIARELGIAKNRVQFYIQAGRKHGDARAVRRQLFAPRPWMTLAARAEGDRRICETPLPDEIAA